MERDFKGIWIPKEIWLSEDLTLQEKVFLVEISSLDGNSGCYANNTYFSNFFGISTTRVSLVIKSLTEKGYLFTFVDESKGNRRILTTSKEKLTSLIKVKDPRKQKLKTSITKVKDPRKQKLKHSNTVNNTINNKKIEKKSVKTDGSLYSDLFENDFWKVWKLSSIRNDEKKAATYKHFKKLNQSEQKKAIENIKKYFDSIENKNFAVIARTYLSDRLFLDELKKFQNLDHKKTETRGRRSKMVVREGFETKRA